MGQDPTKLSLSQILIEAEAIEKDVQSTFSGLDDAQINWKPGADKWSVGQCFDHLITANRCYFPIIDSVLRGENKATLWQSMPFLPGFFGKMLVKALSPDSKQKFKAPAHFRPSYSVIDPLIINKFVTHQREVIKHIKATEGIELDKVIIRSPGSKFISYSLLDAYRIIVVHERRHLKQARKVMETPGFPQ